ncbi:MAG TPA: hypothetical protein PLL92_07550 [Alicycliphilus sp.]|nr:hypothetical protein [Alicycliphilus sp.]
MNFEAMHSKGLRRALPALALAAAGLALTGCVVTPAYPVATQEVVYAPSAPPPLQTEVVPVAPSPVHVWINGYWGWGGGRYAWTPGYWAAAPRTGYVWHPRRWEHGPRGWGQHGGYWGPR